MPDRQVPEEAVEGMAASLAANDGSGHWALVENKDAYRGAAAAHLQAAAPAIRKQERQRVREGLGENVHRVVEALETWLLDYADPDDGDWPERADHVKAINDFRSALYTLEES